MNIAALHYQFEAIHPFVDGRVGRLLVVLLLVEWGLLAGPMLDLSAYVEPRRDRHYETLLRTVMEVLGVTHRWASQTVDKLTDAGILREVPGPGRARLFIAPEVLRAIEGQQSSCRLSER